MKEEYGVPTIDVDDNGVATFTFDGVPVPNAALMEFTLQRKIKL